MQWIASGFLFIRGNTIIHKMDPRVRLLMSLGLFVVSLASHTIGELTIVIVLIILLSLIGRVAKRFAKSMLLTVAISIVAFVVYLLSGFSLSLSVVFGLRLFAVITSTSIFFLTSTPDELEHVMKWLRLPPDFVMIFVIAVRFVPVLLLDALQIMDAQRSRGLEFDKGNIIQRLRKTVPVLVPLIAVALNRSLDLAEAMDSRAYGASKRPTSLYILKLKPSDYVALCVVVAGMSFGILDALFVTLI